MTENKLPSGHTRIDTLEMRGITKRFPGVLANDKVDFDARSGEVHALLGENGAGKSTLMKVLYGLYEPNEGEILLNGKPIQVKSPTDAIKHGIGMIHQHFMLVETLTVAENVALGLPSSRGFLTDLDVVSDRILESMVYKSTPMLISGSFRSGSSSGWKSLKRFIEVQPCSFSMSRPPSSPLKKWMISLKLCAKW